MPKKNTLPAEADAFSDLAGAGMENVQSEDVLIPRITILQTLSPQLKKSKPQYINGAEEGDICSTATGEVWKSIYFLPVHFRKQWIEWAPRESGAGLVRIHDSPAILDDCTRDDRRRPFLPNGNLVQETSQFYGFNITADMTPCFIAMSGTQLKHARKWLSMAKGERIPRADGTRFVAPFFYRVYKLSAAEESNAEGDWQAWRIDRDVALPELDKIVKGYGWEAIKDDAIEFQGLLAKGEAQGDIRTEKEVEEEM